MGRDIEHNRGRGVRFAIPSWCKASIRSSSAAAPHRVLRAISLVAVANN